MLGCCGLSASSKLYLEDAGEAEGGLDEVRVGHEPVADFPHRLEEREPTLCEDLQMEAKIRFCKRDRDCQMKRTGLLNFFLHRAVTAAKKH